MRKIILYTIFFTIVITSCKKDKLNYLFTGNLYHDRATSIVLALQGIEQSSNGLWERCGWWNSANVLEALLDYHAITGINFSSRCMEIYKKNRYHDRGGFKNKSYDDNAWWALAFIKAYYLYGDAIYRQTAEDIFADMLAGGWDNNCNGGMAWQSDERYKNAITNELFIVLAAKLSNIQEKPWLKIYYLDWALKGWHWLNQSGMLNYQHLYNDGLDDNCVNNGKTTWTYNQGVILGGLKELFLITGDSALLQSAKITAYSAMNNLSDTNQILTEPCLGNCGDDGVQFKGIFVRYLSELNLVLKDTTIKQYILHNADVAWEKAQNGNALFDKNWQGPYNNWKGSTTGVALDLMNAAIKQSD